MQRLWITTAACSLLFLAVAAGKARASDSVSSLAWMAGVWTGVQEGVEMEEAWLPPKGETMLAVHRDVAGGRTVSYEFLRIESGKDGIVYWASPHGKPATPFRMIEQGEKRVVFENEKLEFPRRILYWHADGALHAEIEGTRNGKPASEQWTWKPSPRN